MGDAITASLDLDYSYAILHSTSRIPGETLRFDTTFVPGSPGLELNHVRTVTTPAESGSASTSKPPSDTSFDFTYQTVVGFSLPSSLAVQSRGGALWQITLSKCSVRRSETPQ